MTIRKLALVLALPFLTFCDGGDDKDTDGTDTTDDTDTEDTDTEDTDTEDTDTEDTDTEDTDTEDTDTEDTDTEDTDTEDTDTEDTDDTDTQDTDTQDTDTQDTDTQDTDLETAGTGDTGETGDTYVPGDSVDSGGDTDTVDTDTVDTDTVDTDTDIPDSWGDTFIEAETAEPDTFDTSIPVDTDDTAPLSFSFSADVWPILNARCAACHISATSGGLNFSAGYSALVDVPSQDVPSMDYVEPGNSATSYMWHKLAGTHLGVGGANDRMPLTGGYLSGSQLDTIQGWIELGAAP